MLDLVILVMMNAIRQVSFFHSISKGILNSKFLFCTEKHPFSGQNIAERGSTSKYEDTSTCVREMISDWFAEHADADMSHINAYHNHVLG